MLKRKVAFVFAILMLTCFGCSFGACKNNNESEKPGAEISTGGEVDSGDEKGSEEGSGSEEDSDDEEQIQYFNVIFYNEDGSVFEEIKVKKGETLKGPDKTPKDSTKRKEFLGWSLLGDTSVYDFTADGLGIVVAEMSFTAVFGEEEYTPVSK